MSLNSQSAEDIMRTLGTRLRKARKLRKMSQTQLAKLIRTSPNQISMIETGQSGTSIRTMVAAASALNVSLDFLAGLVEVPTSTRDLLYDLREQRAELLDMQGGRTGLLKIPMFDSNVRIEVLDIQTGAGAGSVVYGEAVKSMIEFPGRWLRDHGLQASECRVIGVTGESMEPTIADGCSILIQLTSKTRRNGQIYVIRMGDEVFVKRAMRDTKAGWLLVSDNPDKQEFPTKPWPEDATIIGEVKWYGQAFN